jgi:hypothetical protein
MEGESTERAFAWLDQDRDGKVQADEVAEAVASLITQRADLAATLKVRAGAGQGFDPPRSPDAPPAGHPPLPPDCGFCRTFCPLPSCPTP